MYTLSVHSHAIGHNQRTLASANFTNNDLLYIYCCYKRGQNKVSREDGIRLCECVYTQLAEYDMSRSDLAWACKD